MKLGEVEEIKSNQVFLDLDGVLADFNAKVSELTGKTPSELGHRMWARIADVTIKPESDRHDILTLANKQDLNSIDDLGFPKGHGSKKVNFLIKDGLIEIENVADEGKRYRITASGKEALMDLDQGQEYKSGPDFYNSLAKMPDADQLFHGVKDPIICTGKPMGNWAESQKREWVAREYGPDVPVIVCMAREKAEFASKHIGTDGQLHGAILIDDRESNRAQWESAGGRFILHTSSARSLSELADLLSVE